MSAATYLTIAAVVMVVVTVGSFRINWGKGTTWQSQKEKLFLYSAIHGIIAGALWPIAFLLYIAGRIIYFTTFSGKP